MGYLTIADLGTYSYQRTGDFTFDVAGGIFYPEDMRPGTLIVLVGGQSIADAGPGGPLPAAGDGYGNTFGPHAVGAEATYFLSAAAIYWAGPLGFPAPAGAEVVVPIPYPNASVFWVRGYAISGAEGWGGGSSSGNGNSNPSVHIPLSVPPLATLANPGGMVIVQAGGSVVPAPLLPVGADFTGGLRNIIGAPMPYIAGLYGSVGTVEPNDPMPTAFTLPVDDSMTWAAIMIAFTPRFYAAGNVVSLSKRLGRIGRAVQQITQTDNDIQPAFNRKVETLGDNPHAGLVNLQVGSRCWSLSLGCRGSKRWDLFACKEASSNGNLIAPIADVIHQQSGDDITSWSGPETVLSGRYHSICHVLSGNTGLVLALWDDAEKKWHLSVGSSGDGKGDWTMSEPRLLVGDAQGQASLRQDADGRYWFACVTAGNWSATADTDSGFLRLLRCDALGPDGAGEWDDIPVDDGAVGGGYTGVNLGVKSKGLLVFHLFRRSVTRSTVPASTAPYIGRVVASYSDAHDPNLLVFTAPVVPLLAPSGFAIHPLGPGDLLPRGDGSFYWAYQDTGPIKQRVLSNVLPDGSGEVT